MAREGKRVKITRHASAHVCIYPAGCGALLCRQPPTGAVFRRAVKAASYVVNQEVRCGTVRLRHALMSLALEMSKQFTVAHPRTCSGSCKRNKQKGLKAQERGGWVRVGVTKPSGPSLCVNGSCTRVDRHGSNVYTCPQTTLASFPLVLSLQSRTRRKTSEKKKKETATRPCSRRI